MSAGQVLPKRDVDSVQPRFFCAGGINVPPALCPAGTFCAALGLSTPTRCIGGLYCNATGLTAPSGECAVGQVCPAGASAASACPAGQLCLSAGLSVATPCAPGAACSATAQTITIRNRKDVEARHCHWKMPVQIQSKKVSATSSRLKSPRLLGTDWRTLFASLHSLMSTPRSVRARANRGAFALGGASACAQCPRGSFSASPGLALGFLVFWFWF